MRSTWSNTSARRPVPLDHIVRELATDRKGRATVIHWLVEPGDHRQQRPDVVRGVEEVSPESMELPGDGDVLAQAVARGVVHHRHEVLGQILEGRDILVMAEQEVRVLVVD